MTFGIASWRGVQLLVTTLEMMDSAKAKMTTEYQTGHYFLQIYLNGRRYLRKKTLRNLFFGIQPKIIAFCGIQLCEFAFSVEKWKFLFANLRKNTKQQ